MSEQTAMATTLEWDLADRMRKSLRASGIGVQEMADYLGVGRNTVSTWINGRINPSQQTVRLWAIRCPQRTGEHLTADAVGRLISAALPAGWTAHNLRHRAGTDWHAVNRDMRAVQELLGHASIRTTQLYVQVEDDALLLAVLGVVA